MVLITHNGKVFDFFSTIVSYTDANFGGQVFEVPTNTPSEYEIMVSNNIKLSNFKLTSFSPTDEQRERLAKVNALEKVAEYGGWCMDVHNYVIDGYVDNNSVDFVQEHFLEECKESSREVILNKLKAEVASLRYDKEVGGVSYNGYTVHTDRTSQATITSTVVLFNTGAIETINFKCANDKWLMNLTKEQFTKLALGVSGHVNACFTAEAKVNEELSKLPFEVLSATVSTGRGVGSTAVVNPLPQPVSIEEQLARMNMGIPEEIPEERAGEEPSLVPETKEVEKVDIKQLYDDTYSVIIAAMLKTLGA